MTIWNPSNPPPAQDASTPWSGDDVYRGPKGDIGPRGVEGEPARFEAVRIQSPVTIGVGTQTVYMPVYTNLNWYYGQSLRLQHDTSTYMICTLEDMYTTLTSSGYWLCLVVDVSVTQGSGTFSTWYIAPNDTWSNS